MTAPTHITWAEEQIGKREQGGPNRGPIVRASMGFWTTAEPGDSSLWCAYFASTALVWGGTENALALGSSSAETLHERMRPCWVDEQPRRGDVVWFPRAGNKWHVGLVCGTAGAGREVEVTTIEGNADNAVKQRVYKWAVTSIKGLARPRAPGVCGSLPPLCGVPMQPCVQPAWHEGACDEPKPLGPDMAIGLRPERVGHSKQGRALAFMRAGRPVEDIARAFGTIADCWTLLEQGALFVTPETFARLCRGLASI